MDERVLAYDASHRDVVGSIKEEIGKAPALNDIFENLIKTYDEASERFHKMKQKDGIWGFFRSLWPAALLVDKRIDFSDPKTRSWLFVFFTFVAMSLVVSVFSICFFIASIYRNFHIGWLYQQKHPEADAVTETWLANTVVLCHAVLVFYFGHCSLRGMFYFEINTGVLEINFFSRQST